MVGGRVYNWSDHLKLYTSDIKEVVDELVRKNKYTVEQALEIVRLATENMKVDVEHHKEESLQIIAFAIEENSRLLDLCYCRKPNNDYEEE